MKPRKIGVHSNTGKSAMNLGEGVTRGMKDLKKKGYSDEESNTVKDNLQSI